MTLAATSGRSKQSIVKPHSLLVTHIYVLKPSDCMAGVLYPSYWGFESEHANIMWDKNSKRSIGSQDTKCRT